MPILRCTNVKILFLLFFLLTSLNVNARRVSKHVVDSSDVQYLYQIGNYDKALLLCFENIKKKENVRNSLLVAGKIYFERRNFDSSIFFFDFLLKVDNNRSFMSGWAHGYLGAAYLAKQQSQKGNEELEKCIAMNATENSVQFAMKARLKYTPVDSLVKKLGVYKISGKHIDYYFSDSTKIGTSVANFILKHDKAMDLLLNEFKADLKQRISYFVIDNENLFFAQNKVHLGVTYPEQFLSFVRPHQTVGHELCHIASYWALNGSQSKENRFVSEGISVCFDYSGRDLIGEARTTIATSLDTHFNSIKAIWDESSQLPENVMYPIAGAFIRFIYKKLKHEAFLNFVKNQSQDEIRKAVGGDAEFEALIKEFDTLVELK